MDTDRITDTDKDLTPRQRMLRGIARTLSGNTDIEVVFSNAGECKTNLQTMWLPESDAIEEDIILSLMAHELGHLKYTDFETTKAIQQLPNRPEENLVVFHITNMLEDLRIEKKIAEAYPGFGSLFMMQNVRTTRALSRAWPHLVELNRVLVAAYFLFNNKQCDYIKTGYFLAAAYLMRGYENFLETSNNTWDVMDIAIEIFQRIRRGMPGDMQELIKTLRENEAIVELLQRRASRVENRDKCPHCGYGIGAGEVRCPRCGGDIPVSEEQEQQPRMCEISVQGKAEQNPGGRELTPVADTLHFDDTVVRVDPGQYNQDYAHKQPTLSGGVHGRMILNTSLEVMQSMKTQVADPEPVNNRIVSCSDIVKKVVRETIRRERNKARTARKKTYYSTHPLLREAVKRGKTEFEVSPGPSTTYQQIRASVQKDIAFLCTRLKRILAWDVEQNWRSGHVSGRKLDRRRLWRIPSGERRLFSHKQEERKKLSIAFTLLVDESGSMDGAKAIEARRTAVLFSEVLHSFNIPFEVIGYTTAQFNHWYLNRIQGGPSNVSYNAALPLRHDMFKRFDEDFRAVKTRLTRMNAFEGNEDAESLKFAWERLRRRREKHRVLILAFDSLVVGGQESRNELARIVRSIDTTPGAACFGIGIEAPFTGDFFPRFVNINNANLLGENVIRLIADCVSDAMN